MRKLLPLVVPAAAAALVLGVLPASAGADATASAPTSLTNPVTSEIADSWADPAVIRGKDGWWYAYATSDPLREGDTVIEPMHVARSQDLVDWEYLGNVFDEAAEPSWADDDSFFWAPDVRYVDGRYLMYYTATNTLVSDQDFDVAIGVATAPTPTGPWTDSGAPVIEPVPSGNGDYLGTIDPAMLTARDGTRYLYYGGYYGGIFATELSDDGLRRVGEPTRVTIDNRYEGAYVVERDGFYYLTVSAANCCAGPATGYSVFAGRSTSPTGPFVDRDGISLLDSRVGGTVVVSPNGNHWIGTGHHAFLTDASGQDWMAYHAIDRRDPYLNGTDGINERPMLIDRLDWVDGWPTVRAGAWASEGPVAPPVTTGPVDDDFDAGLRARDWRRIGGGWVERRDRDAGTYVQRTLAGRSPGMLLARDRVPGDRRLEVDVRSPRAVVGAVGGTGTAGLVVRWSGPRDHVVAAVDASRSRLVVVSTRAGRETVVSEPLPASFDPTTWHVLAATLRGDDLVVDVTDAGLGDPYAVLETALAPARRDTGVVGVVADDGPVDLDNVLAAGLSAPVTEPVATPQVGALDAAYSDELDGELAAGTTWVREDPDARVEDGALVWPTQAADLVGGANDAALLLREAPQGDYVVETRLTIDLGTGTVRNFQQGGLVAYVDDDEFVRLSHVAIWNTRQTEFGKELRYDGGTRFGGMLVGTPADTTWLRLAHTLDPENGEHELRAGTSRDGVHWTWGGTWTLPAGTEPRIGLVSHGGDAPQATARFDYLRVYR